MAEEFNDDGGVLVDQTPGKLVHRILAAVADPGVDRPNPLLFASPLSNCQLSLLVAVPASVELLAIGAGGGLLAAQVDADHPSAGAFRFGNFHRYVEVPAPTGVLVEAGGFEPVLRQPVAVPDLVVLAVEVHLTVLPSRGPGVDRDPAERASNTEGLAPRQSPLSELVAPGDVLFTHPLNGVTVQPQALGCAVRVLLNIVGRQKLPTLADRSPAQLVHVVPDDVHRRRLPP